MGWGTLPEVGTEYGPCVETCEHRDCAATRADAASVCHYCGDPIGYDTKYYTEGEAAAKRLVHAVCVWKRRGG